MKILDNLHTKKHNSLREPLTEVKKYIKQLQSNGFYVTKTDIGFKAVEFTSPTTATVMFKANRISDRSNLYHVLLAGNLYQ
mgnify:FL=1